MGPGHAFSSAAAIFRLPPACVTDIMKALTDSPVRHTCGKKKGWDIMELSALQNGSDIRGVAVDAKNGQPVNLTREAVVPIARAFARWLKQRTGKEQVRVAVGRDSRISGPAISGWALEGLGAEGALCTNFALASTPAMFMCTVMGAQPFDGAVMVTASHLPYNRNGLKFFTSAGGLEGSDIKAILAQAQLITPQAAPQAQQVQQQDFMSVYAAHLASLIRDGVKAKDYLHPLAGLHIVVDAGNGAGGFFAEKVLAPLGADISGSRYLAPDGMFPNHIPNPEDAAAMASIRQAVLEEKADLGIIFDTDVDRAGAVLPDGEELNRNRLIALMSAILLRDHPGTAIVTDSVTSTGLARFIAQKGGVHHRFKRGYRNVINEAVRLNREGTDCQLAMETSGHGALKENYFMDDGAYLMVKLLIELGRGHRLEEMIAGLREPAESKEVRLPLSGADFKADGAAVLKRMAQKVQALPGASTAPDNREGIRVNFDAQHGNGWFLLRLSLHDPLMPLNFESDSPGGVKVIAKTVYSLLQQEASVLDLSPLAQAVE